MNDSFFTFLIVAVIAAGTCSAANPEEVTAVVGQTARLDCYLTPDINGTNWTSANIGLISQDFRIVPRTDRYGIEQNKTRHWTLVIKNVQYSDEGIYTCRCVGQQSYELQFHLKVTETVTSTTKKNNDDENLTSLKQTSTPWKPQTSSSPTEKDSTISIKPPLHPTAKEPSPISSATKNYNHLASLFIVIAYSVATVLIT